RDLLVVPAAAVAGRRRFFLDDLDHFLGLRVMVEQAADALRQQYAARHAGSGLHGTAEEAAGAAAGGGGIEGRRSRPVEARRARLTPATTGGRRALRLRSRAAGPCAKDARQETATGIAATGSLELGLGLLQLGLELLVPLVQTLDRGLLDQDRLGHVVR